MGLDISAYRQMTKLNKFDLELDDDGYPVNGDALRLFDQSDYWPRQGEGIDISSYYDYGKEDFGFRAGGYSWYNAWRSQLAQMAGLQENDLTVESTEPFAELVFFSDCEGYIGPVVSAKLARDFSDFAERALEFSKTHEHFLDNYNNFRYAFEMASDNGMVNFH